MRRLFAGIFSALILISACLPLTVSAAETNVAVDTMAFDGFNVTVLDKTAPAVDMRGRTNDRNVMCFVSADDKEVGVISYSDYWAVIEKNKRVVKDAGGGTWSAPPSGYSRWHDWFADEFNKLRGLVAGSREEAVASDTAETIEQYRQELIRLVNVEREEFGLVPYIINDECMRYSQIRAEELATSYSHTRPDGTNAGYEIITGAYSPENAVTKWMNSDGHRAAILNANRVYVGAGCYITSNGTMYFQMYFERDPEVYANTLILG